MRLAVLQPVFSVRRCVLGKTFYRSFSVSVASAGADKPPSRGVPLAFDLDGINIRQRAPPKTQPRVSLGRRLTARLRGASHVDASTLTKGAQLRATRAPERNTPRQDRPQDTTSARPPRDGTQASSRPANSRVASTTQAGGAGRDARASGPRSSNAGAQGSRAQGQTQGQMRGQGRSGNDAAPQRKAKAKAQRKPRDRDQAGSANRGPVNEEYIGGGRNFDNNGVLKLKERDVVPILEVPEMSPLDSIFGAFPNPTTPISQKMLQLKSYHHHGAPGVAGHKVLGVVDNAQLALSHVRDLDVPHRREALDIVSRLSNTVKPAVEEARG